MVPLRRLRAAFARVPHPPVKRIAPIAQYWRAQWAMARAPKVRAAGHVRRKQT